MYIGKARSTTPSSISSDCRVELEISFRAAGLNHLGSPERLSSFSLNKSSESVSDGLSKSGDWNFEDLSSRLILDINEKDLPVLASRYVVMS